MGVWRFWGSQIGRITDGECSVWTKMGSIARFKTFSFLHSTDVVLHPGDNEMQWH